MIDEAMLTEQIVRELVAAAPEGWVSLRYAVATMGNVSDHAYTARLRDGTEQWVWSPTGTSLPLRKLRTAMYREGEGTWFSTVIQVAADGSSTVSYD
jgi:hypothetical protein